MKYLGLSKGLVACGLVTSMLLSGAVVKQAHASNPERSIVLLDKSGSGAWTSPTFDPTSDWQISYSYSCSNQGGKGNFIVEVYGPGNELTGDGANELKTGGRGTTYVHDVTGRGTYVQVNSECNWHLTAKGPGSGPTTAQTHPHTLLLNHRGSGEWTSPTFKPTRDWQIAYSYNCSGQGGVGNFIADVYGPGNAPSTDGVNELKRSGGGTTYVHDVKGKGTYLRINSECNWHVTAAQ